MEKYFVKPVGTLTYLQLNILNTHIPKNLKLKGAVLPVLEDLELRSTSIKGGK